MQRTVQVSDVLQLSAAITPLDDGYHFMFTQRAARQRGNEELVRFQRQFSADELRRLRDLIDQQLRARPALAA